MDENLENVQSEAFAEELSNFIILLKFKRPFPEHRHVWNLKG